jgi:hypothetical protein
LQRRSGEGDVEGIDSVRKVGKHASVPLSLSTLDSATARSIPEFPNLAGLDHRQSSGPESALSEAYCIHNPTPTAHGEFNPSPTEGDRRAPVRGCAGGRFVSTSLTLVGSEVDSPHHGTAQKPRSRRKEDQRPSCTLPEFLSFLMLSELPALADTRPQASEPSVKRPGPIAVRLGLESLHPHCFWYGC